MVVCGFKRGIGETCRWGTAVRNSPDENIMLDLNSPKKPTSILWVYVLLEAHSRINDAVWRPIGIMLNILGGFSTSSYGPEPVPVHFICVKYEVVGELRTPIA